VPRELTTSLLTALLTGFVSLPAAERSHRRFLRLFLAPGGLAGLAIHIFAACITCLVFGVLLLGPLALFRTWPPRGYQQYYGVALLLGFVLARITFRPRRRDV
jgi:hypothetical protein